ncbi:Pectinesterase inhibitor domain [Dillenia turbinata]|uniref:pectinesterase n=1 Tax=Dillenia turbinata TaxID=194707 RepID=A0AAN8ZKE2_9MAGN
MASKLFSLSNLALVLISFVIFLSFFSSSLADPPPSSPVSSRSLCKSTQNPSFCTTVLPSNQNGNVYYYGRYSIRQALSASRKFLNLVQKYLRNPKTLSTPAVRALQDCEFLAQLNMEYLTTYYATFNTNTTLPTSQADNVQTFLSAILTNQQTCLDGISSVSSAWSVKNGLYTPLSNDTKLYSLSLDLFTKGWVPKNQKKKTTWTPTAQQRMFSKGHLPLKMSDRTRNIYESVSGRKLLQTDDQALDVSDIVVVSQDGTGNFTLINDAVASAPNNSDGSSYFLIYIVGGVYEEYVSIPKNKKYLMMMGDGINQTVITGNHSYVDGWTTFNSATFVLHVGWWVLAYSDFFLLPLIVPFG